MPQNNAYRFEKDWKPYVYPDRGACFASDEDIKETFSKIDMSALSNEASGIPVLTECNYAYVNNMDEMTLIAGESGSKKTRCVVRPLIHSCIKAENSMIIPDIKGELVSNPAIYAELKKHNYQIVRLNYRDFAGDGYNVLEHPTELYMSGNKDMACRLVRSFYSGLFNKYRATNADPYWADMSQQHANGVTELLMRIAANNKRFRQYVNLATINACCNEHDMDLLKNFIADKYSDCHHPAIVKLSSVASAPDKTRNCIISTTASVLAEFSDFDALMRMHSYSTFNIREAYERPMAIFIILPDETDAFNSIAGQVIDSFYSQLIDVYTKNYLDNPPPRRIEFICDEFCNMYISDMSSKISASRSRYIRWYLIIQSINQMKSIYENDWQTIIGNCKNIYFLQSSDPELREYISNLAGNTTVSTLSGGEPLLPAERLKDLKKDRLYKEAIFIRDNIVYKATLPDIDTYTVVQTYKGMPAVNYNSSTLPETKVIRISELIWAINRGKIELPFCETNADDDISF